MMNEHFPAALKTLFLAVVMLMAAATVKAADPVKQY